MANAAHISKKTKDGGSKHVVGLGDLRVMILRESDTVWYAQGLEIDYIAQGTSQDSVMKAFERGLFMTITEHLKVHGNIVRLLQPAPKEVWAEFFQQAPDGQFRFSHVGSHKLSEPAVDGVRLVATTDPPPKKKSKAKAKAPAPKRVQAILPFDTISYLKCA